MMSAWLFWPAVGFFGIVVMGNLGVALMSPMAIGAPKVIVFIFVSLAANIGALVMFLLHRSHGNLALCWLLVPVVVGVIIAKNAG